MKINKEDYLQMLKGTHYKELPSAYLNRQFIEGLVQQNDAQSNVNGEQKQKNFFTNQQSEQFSSQMKNQELSNKQEIFKTFENVKCLKKEEEDHSQSSAIPWMRSLLSSTYNEAVQQVLSEKCKEVQSTSHKGQFDSKLLDIHILRCQLQLNTETKENAESFQQEETVARSIRHRNSSNNKNNNKCKALDDKVPKPVSSSYAEQSKLKKLFYLTHNQNHNINNTLPLSQTLTGYPKATSLTRCRKDSKESSMQNTKRIISPHKSKEKKSSNRSTSFVKQNRNNQYYPIMQDTNHSHRQDNNTSLKPSQQNTSQTQNYFDGCHNNNNNQQDLNHLQNELRQTIYNTKPKDISYVSQDLYNTSTEIQNCSKLFESIDNAQNTTNPQNTTNSSFYQSLLNSQQQRKPARKVSPYQQQQKQQKVQEDYSTFNQEDYSDDSPQQHPKKNGYHQSSIPANSLAIKQQKLNSVQEDNKLEISQVMENQQINNTFLRNLQSNPQKRDIHQQSYLSCTSNNASTSVGSAQETKLNSAQQIPKRHMRSFSRQ